MSNNIRAEFAGGLYFFCAGNIQPPTIFDIAIGS